MRLTPIGSINGSQPLVKASPLQAISVNRTPTPAVSRAGVTLRGVRMAVDSIDAEEAVYSEMLLEFPCYVYALLMTCVLTVLYGAMVLWVARATVWELSRAGCCAEAERRRPCAHVLENYTLVLCITCVACLTSLCRSVFYFVPTLLHGTLHNDTLTVIAALFDRVLGAVSDSVWFSAMAQLIAFWLELLATMHAAKRVRKCCWFSVVASTLFATLRISGAVLVTISRTAQRATLALAFAVVWVTMVVGAVAALRLYCHIRSTVAKNPAARAIQVKMLRFRRFLAVNITLFVLLNAAIGVGWLGRSLTQRSNPTVILAWEAPRHIVRIALYASVAWFNTASTKRRTVRGRVYACLTRAWTRCSAREPPSEFATMGGAAGPNGRSSDPWGGAGCEAEGNVFSTIADAPHGGEKRRGSLDPVYPSLRSSRRLWGGKTLEEIYTLLEAGAVVRDRAWLGKTYRACAEAQEMIAILVRLDCVAELYSDADDKKKSDRHAREFAVEICRELQRKHAIEHVWGKTELSTFRDMHMFFRFCLEPPSGAGGGEERASVGSAMVAFDLSLALTPKSSMLSLVERTPTSTPLGSRERDQEPPPAAGSESGLFANGAALGSLAVDVVRRGSSSSFPSPLEPAPHRRSSAEMPSDISSAISLSSDDGGDAVDGSDDCGDVARGARGCNASLRTLVI